MLKSAKAVVSARSADSLSQPIDMAVNGSLQGDSRRPATHTITGLRRWSVINKDLPGENIRFVVCLGSFLGSLTDCFRNSCFADKDNTRLRL